MRPVLSVTDGPDGAEPVYVGAGDAAAFGLLHRATGAARDVAVLLAPPFGWEDMCSYRPRREWAATLAAAGYDVLRVDLPGSGDSAGTPRDAALPAAWAAALAAAAAHLRAVTGCRRVAAIGIGLGGVVAAQAVAAGAPIDDLALWGVPARGKRLVRELRTFSMLEEHGLDGAATDGAEGPVAEAGALAVAGYVLSADTLAALSGVDLATLAVPDAAGRHLLVLGRDGRAADAALEARLRETGATVTVGAGEGYAAMLMVEPQESRASPATLAEIAAWLDGFAGVAAAARPPANGAAPPSLELHVDGAALRETPVVIPHAFGAPFGVLTEPVAPARAPALCLVLLNAGPQRRTGPNRMWVEVARRWAARGVPSLRVDLAGIGDAGGDGTRFDDVASFYQEPYLEQVREILDLLEARGLPPRFVTLGLCAGGWWALEAEVADPRVVAAVLLNPGALLWDGGWTRTIYEAEVLRRKATSLDAWRRVLHRDTTFRIHFRTLRRLAWGIVVTRWQRLGARTGRGPLAVPAVDPLHARLDRLRDDGRRLTLVFAGAEPLYETLTTQGHLDHLGRWPNVDLRRVGADVDLHTLRPLWLQRQAHRIIDEAVAREVDGPRDGAP